MQRPLCQWTSEPTGAKGGTYLQLIKKSLCMESRSIDFKQIVLEILIEIEVRILTEQSSMSTDYLCPFLLAMTRMHVPDRSLPRPFLRVLSLPKQRADSPLKQWFSKLRVSELQCKLTAHIVPGWVVPQYHYGT